MQRPTRSFTECRTRAAAWALIGTVLLAGCVNTTTVAKAPEALRQEIRAGDLVKPGDRVSVVTIGTGEHIFTVAGVDTDVIRGEGIEVPIDDVVALQMHELDEARSWTAVGGVTLGVGALLAILMAASIASAFP